MTLFRKEAVDHQNDTALGEIIIPTSAGFTLSALLTRTSCDYQTLVGETGGTLSGGQKQRILLARALYKRPGFLLLDEATSHLDVESEILIGQTLRATGTAVLLIAHRQETLTSADRVLYMDGGKFVLQVAGHEPELVHPGAN